MGNKVNNSTESKESEDPDTAIDDVEDTANGKKDIVKSIWGQITGEDMLSRLVSPKEHIAGNAWGKLCHRCDISYPSSKELSIIDMFDIDSMVIINQMRYALRHAVLAYPPQFLVLCAALRNVKMDTLGANAFKTFGQIMRSTFNIPAHDLIMNNLIKDKLHEPAFYLVVDRARSLIVLSIRGTVTLGDALTDVDAIAKKHSAFDIDGYVHPGILSAAKGIKKKVDDPLVGLCQKFKEFQVIFTGHSLGAGVAAMLGFLYRDHPIIFKQNRLQCYAFASPPVVSRDFTEKQIGTQYITSIALSTDLVTRLSVESIKKMNARLDIIRRYRNEDKGIIKECLQNTKDPVKFDDDEDGDGDEMKEDKWWKLVDELKNTPTPNPQQQLFPLGKILWFVPKGVMVESDEQRRMNLLGIQEENDSGNESNIDLRNITMKEMTDVITDTLKSIGKMTGIKKKRKCFDGSQYILCDATNCRHLFQELVQDMPESLSAHFPIRYLLASYTKL